MIGYNLSVAGSLRAVGARARELRLVRKLRQEELAIRAGVGVATVRRFEKAGVASFESVVRIAMALRADRPFATLFEAPRYASIDDALSRPDVTRRQRAPKAR